MTSNPKDGAGKHLPLFNFTKSTFTYTIAYAAGKMIQTINYNAVHELILNLHCFQKDDTITYVSREEGCDLMTLTVNEFKATVVSMLDTSTHEQLELFYARLLLTNHYSKSIADRGRFRQFDFTLRTYLITLKGGIDSHLSYENNKVILYLKYRRLSINHLVAKVTEWTDGLDISLVHLNIPRGISNQGLMGEILKVYLRKNQFRLYHYDPIAEADNDQIILTEPAMTSTLLQVIHHLLK